jgi:hypothetical protein
MLLKEVYRTLHGTTDPVAQCKIEVIDTWEDLIATIKEPFLSQLVGPNWTYHNDKFEVAATPYTNPAWFRRHWFPEGEDNAAFKWTQPDGTIKRVMCTTREDMETLRVNVTFGKLQDSNQLHALWWDQGIRMFKQYVHGDKQLAKVLERGDDDSVRWEYEQNPDRPFSNLGKVYNLRCYLLKRPEAVTRFDYHPGDPRWVGQEVVDSV